MSDFTAGFVARHEAVAQALHQAFEVPPEGFAAAGSQDLGHGRIVAQPGGPSRRRATGRSTSTRPIRTPT